MTRKIFSYPEAQSISPTDKMHGLIGGSNRVFTVQQLKDLFFANFPNGTFENAQITVVNNKIVAIAQGTSFFESAYAVNTSIISQSVSTTNITAGSYVEVGVGDPLIQPDSFVIVVPPSNIDPMFTVTPVITGDSVLKIYIINHKSTDASISGDFRILLLNLP
jgi:hypothetical protein